MEIPTVRIPAAELELLIRNMERAERYCRNARSDSWPFSPEEPRPEATEFYSGASGYAGATLRTAIQTLETYQLF